MRKLMMVMLPLVLAGCSSEPAQQPEAAESPTPETVALVTANGSAAGTYQVTAADGTVTTAVLAPDGTYTDTDATGAVTEQGTWATVNFKTCFTPNTEGAHPLCYAESAPAADGSFTATPDEGDPVTVRPVAATTPAP